VIDEKDKGLVLYLPFEENYGSFTLDWSGYDNSAQIFGASWTYGKIGRALQFDGVDDYVEVPSSASLSGLNTITVIAWIYPTKTTEGTIISKHDNRANREWLIYISPYYYKYVFQVFDENTDTFAEAIGISVEKNKWTHIAGVYDNGRLQIYCNSELIASTTTNITIRATTCPVRIGNRADNARYYGGIIDDVRIYNRALSEEEIKDIYLSTVHKFYPIRFAHLRTFPGCILNLNFEERTVTIAYDQSGFKNHGTIYGASWTYGKIGRALYFDGVDDYIDCGTKTIFKLSSAFSILGWFKFDPGTTGGKGIVQKVVGTTDFDYMLYLSAAGYPAVYFRNPSGTPYSVNYTRDIRDGKWHHWAATFDGRYLKIYIDGILRNVSDTGGTSVRTTDTPLYIGRGWGGYVRMTADEIRIYNRALSDREIISIYYQGIKTAQKNPIV
jgi:hypothetical protein